MTCFPEGSNHLEKASVCMPSGCLIIFGSSFVIGPGSADRITIPAARIQASLSYYFRVHLEERLPRPWRERCVSKLESQLAWHS